MPRQRRNDPHEMSAEDYRWTIRPPSEAEFTRMVMNEAQARNWSAYHTHDSRRSPAGFPDLVLANPNHAHGQGAVYAELKMPGNYSTPAQRVWLTTLLHCGHRVYLWYPSDFKSIIAVLDGELLPGYETIAEKRRKRYTDGSPMATKRSR